MTPNELPQVDLPPLPKCAVSFHKHGEGEISDYYTADQMREYARTALSTLTAQGGEAWQVLKDDGTHSFFTMSRTEAEDYKHGLGRTVIPCTIAPTPPAPSSSAVESKRERLENERWRMMNAFGGSAFHDGAVQKRIDEIDAELQALASTAASGGDSIPNAEEGDFDCPKAAASRNCQCGFCKSLRSSESTAGGGKPVARLTTYADSRAITARIHDVATSLPPGTYDLYTAAHATPEGEEVARVINVPGGQVVDWPKGIKYTYNLPVGTRLIAFPPLAAASAQGDGDGK